MRRPLQRTLAPRAGKAGAFYVGARVGIVGPPPKIVSTAVPLTLVAVMLSAAFIPSEATAQIPGIGGPPPDSLLVGAMCSAPALVLAAADSSAMLADSTAMPADSTAMPADSAAIPADSTAIPADSTAILADSTAILADSLAILADSGRVAPRPIPTFSPGPAPSYGLGIWCWDRGALLSTRAVTLAELIALIPGVITLKGGDYGTPVTV
ncbi:MAG: hypothetical protein V3T24_12950, partial [Longimicrobiales bacterium]